MSSIGLVVFLQISFSFYFNYFAQGYLFSHISISSNVQLILMPVDKLKYNFNHIS